MSMNTPFTVAQLLDVIIGHNRSNIQTHSELLLFLQNFGLDVKTRPSVITYQINDFGTNPETLYVQVDDLFFAVCDNLDANMDGVNVMVVTVPIYMNSHYSFMLFDYVPTERLHYKSSVAIELLDILKQEWEVKKKKM